MALTEFSFIVLLAVTTLAYFLVPKRVQWVALLLASAVFYLSYGPGQAVYVVCCALITYLGGLLLGRLNLQTKQPGADKPRIRRTKRLVLLAALALDLGMLITLKYAGMLLPLAKGFVQPLGISFYTLSAVGYLMDLYRAKYEPEKNPLRLLLFVSFFLQIVQGPFARYDLIGKELREPRAFDFDNLKLGSLRMLWGYLKKMVIADWLGVYVSAAMDSPADQSGPVMMIAIVLYTVQMYADFSGYMDIVCGAGQALGLRIPENFDRPLGARSVAEFWRRWHMTLGAWFKDYVFYPVSVSKVAVRISKALRGKGKLRLAKLAPAILALCVVWPLTGLWHGATWNFLLWGLLNGAAIVTSMLMEPLFKKWFEKMGVKPEGRLWKVFSVARTFALLALIRVFARTDSVPQAMAVFSVLGDFGGFDWAHLDAYFPDLRMLHAGYCMGAMGLAAVMFLVEAFGQPHELLVRFNRSPLVIKYALGIALLYAVILCSASSQAINSTFLYANF